MDKPSIQTSQLVQKQSLKHDFSYGLLFWLSIYEIS